MSEVITGVHEIDRMGNLVETKIAGELHQPENHELQRAPEMSDSPAEPRIPKKVTNRWDGELLTLSETAQRLGLEEAEVRKLRFAWELLGLPGGTRKHRRYFFPSFQIDTARGEIYPQAREATKIVSRRHTSWGITEWWSSIEPKLDRKPMELIGTPEADAVVRAARERFVLRI